MQIRAMGPNSDGEMRLGGVSGATHATRLMAVADKSFPAPVIALLAGVLLTLVAFDYVRDDSRDRTETRFDRRHADILHAIDERMYAYSQSLRGALGLIQSSDDVTRDDWRSYVATLELPQHYPGIQGVGYAEWIMPEELERYEARIRAEGFPDFRVKPEGRRAAYVASTFLEPFDERNQRAFGFDMYSDETRRHAIHLARDSGDFAISGKVRLLQETADDVQAGFVLYLPYYGGRETPASLEERRSANEGFVFGAFRMRDLMVGILGQGLPDVRLQIFDGSAPTDDALLYDSGSGALRSNAMFAKEGALNFGQRAWSVRLTSLPSFESQIDRQKSMIVLAGGLFASLLLFGVMRSFTTTRARAEELAAEMTRTLEQRSRELARSNAELEQFAYVASHDLKAPLRGIDHLAVWIERDLGDRLDGESRENMTLLRRRIARLESLLSDLLSYSRATQEEAVHELVDVGEVAGEAFELVRAGRPFTIRFDLDPERAVLPQGPLDQVFRNLFSNTMKHHDRGEGAITVKLRHYGAMYEFSVTDDGPGIPLHLRDRAFKMFQTLRPRDEVEGSGMGLAIIRKIVEHHGGSISIEDGPGGRGAEFRFTWPVRAVEEQSR